MTQTYPGCKPFISIDDIEIEWDSNLKEMILEIYSEDLELEAWDDLEK